MDPDTARIMVTPQKGMRGQGLSQGLDEKYDQDSEVSIISQDIKQNQTGHRGIDPDQA